MSKRRTEQDGKVHSSNAYPGKIFPALLHNPERTEGAKVLYAHMDWRYGRNQDNHEGQRSMAAHLGVSEKTIANRILELEYDDWVVVEVRARKVKDGNFTTPFYHVFDRQDECQKFRKTYKPADGNYIRPKPSASEVPTRTSRKGKGGLADAKNQHRLNTGSDRAANTGSDGGQNTHSDHALNSYSDNPLTVELRADDPRPDEQPAPSGAGANSASKSRKQDELYNLISEVWNETAGGWVGTLKAMLLGTAKRGAWKDCNFDIPVTVEELQAFREWNEVRGWHIPKTPEEIQRRFYDFRRIGNPPMSERSDINDWQPPAPEDAIDDEKRQQMQAMFEDLARQKMGGV